MYFSNGLKLVGAGLPLLIGTIEKINSYFIVVQKSLAPCKGPGSSAQ